MSFTVWLDNDVSSTLKCRQHTLNVHFLNVLTQLFVVKSFKKGLFSIILCSSCIFKTSYYYIILLIRFHCVALYQQLLEVLTVRVSLVGAWKFSFVKQVDKVQITTERFRELRFQVLTVCHPLWWMAIARAQLSQSFTRLIQT